MKLSNYIEASRFNLLLKMELNRSKKGLLLTFAVTFGILFTGFFLENIFSSSKVYASHAGSYIFFLLLGGFILSSLAFSDLRNPLRRYHYLTLPASTFEKFLSMWLLSCVGWIIMFTVTFTLYTWVANSMGTLFFKNIQFIAFNPFSPFTIASARYYIMFQAIFLVGAVQFKGYVFPKTIFTIILFGMICGLIFYIIMADLIHSGMECTAESNPLQQGILLQMWHVLRWIGWWLLAPMSWLITYIGLKEQEV
jgi:hypothetical protein